MFRFTIRDVLWLTAVVTLLVVLWVTRGTQIGARRPSDSVAPSAENPAPTPPPNEKAALPDNAADRRGTYVASGPVSFGGHASAVRHLKLSHDGDQLLSCNGGRDGAPALRLWDATSGKLIIGWPAFSSQIAGIAFTPDGKRVLAASPGTIQVCDAADGHEIARQWVGEGILCLAVGTQPGIAALGLRSGDVAIWDYAAGIEKRRLRGHTQPVRAVSFTSGGQRLASAADDQTLRLWNVDTGESLAGNSAPQINTQLQEQVVAHAQNELAAAQLARDEYLSGTFVQEEKRLLAEVFVAEQNLTAAERGVQSSKRLIDKGIVTSKQLERAQTVAENARQILDLWQNQLDTLRKYTKPRMLRDRDNAIAAAQAALLSEEERLADERVALGEGSFARLATPIRAIAVSTDGKQLAVTQEPGKSDGSSPDDSLPEAPAVIVYDAETGDMRHQLRGPTGSLYAIAFTPSGRSLLAGGSDRVVFQWDLGTSELVSQRQAPEAFSNLIVSSDGRHFFTAGGGDKKPLLQTPPHGEFPIHMWRLDEN